MKFEYIETTSVDEAVSLLGRYEGKAKLMAGGTDLIVQMRKRAIKPEYIIYIGKIKGLDYISYEDKKGLRLGALTTIRALEKSDEVHMRYAMISQVASQMASVGVRNIGTLGGNLCNASPSADMAPGLIGLSALAKIVGPGGNRQILLEKFFTGPGTTVLDKGELLVELEVPLISSRTGATYLKHGMRGNIDLAMVGVAAVITLEEDMDTVREARIVLGAVAPTPVRARQAEAVLKGKKITEEDIEEAGHMASKEARPITDVRAIAEYRREMVHVFTKHAIREALKRAKSV